MANDREKAFEISDDGLLLEGGSHFSSGVATPTHSGLRGDLYLNTTNFSLYRLAVDGSVWGLISGKEIFFDNTGLKFNSSTVHAAIEEVRTKTTFEIETLTSSLNGNHNVTVDDSNIHIVRGTATGYSVTLPDATLLFIGRKFEVGNDSSETVLVKDNSGATIATLIAGDTALLTLETNSIAAGAWIIQTITNSATGITSYTITSTTPFSTDATTDTLITGFTVTPVQGRYYAIYSADIVISQNNRIAQTVIYKAGVAESNTRRIVQGVGSGFEATSVSVGEITVNGSQAVDVRVNVSSGSVTVNQRSLLLIRLGS